MNVQPGAVLAQAPAGAQQPVQAVYTGQPVQAVYAGQPVYGQPVLVQQGRQVVVIEEPVVVLPPLTPEQAAARARRSIFHTAAWVSLIACVFLAAAAGGVWYTTVTWGGSWDQNWYYFWGPWGVRWCNAGTCWYSTNWYSPAVVPTWVNFTGSVAQTANAGCAMLSVAAFFALVCIFVDFGASGRGSSAGVHAVHLLTFLCSLIGMITGGVAMNQSGVIGASGSVPDYGVGLGATGCVLTFLTWLLVASAGRK